jgi:hypothetical protein
MKLKSIFILVACMATLAWGVEPGEDLNGGQEFSSTYLSKYLIALAISNKIGAILR